MVKLLSLMLTFFFTMTVQSQNSASAMVNSRATIIEPIKITKSVDLDFGNVISSFNPGVVVLSPDGTRIAQGVEISSTFPGNVTAAEAVVNHGNNKYSITLPQSFTLYRQDDPNQTLVIDEFKIDPKIGKTVDVLKIGATLYLEANQPSGFYTNASGFNITVSYN